MEPVEPVQMNICQSSTYRKDLSWLHFGDELRVQKVEGKDINKAKNVGFRVYDQGIVTCEQNKLGLSAYYDKRYVLADEIHTRPLDF